MPITVKVPAKTRLDATTSMVVKEPEYVLVLEHSLVSLSKWEQKHKKAFLGKEEKTTEEVYSYFEAMCVTPDVPSDVFRRFGSADNKRINAYIEDSMTATTFREEPRRGPQREIVTAELIYQWLIGLQIPLDRETWHLNTLFALIRVVNIKNTPPGKMSKAQLAAKHRSINAANHARFGVNG